MGVIIGTTSCNPDSNISHDLILAYKGSLNSAPFTFEYLSRSNIETFEETTVLTDEELIELSSYCEIIKRHYFDNIPHSCDCSYKDFALDIEFKLDSSVTQRKIYIKQARIFNTPD